MQPATAIRQDAHSLLTTVAAVLLGLSLNVLAARFLGPAGKGMLDLAGTSAAFFTLVLGFSLNAGLTRHVAFTRYVPVGLIRRLWLWAALSGAGIAAFLLGQPEPSQLLGLLPATDTGFWTTFIAGSTTLGIAAAALRGVLIGRGGLITANRIDIFVKLLLVIGYLGAAFFCDEPSSRLFACAALPALVLLPLLLQVGQRGPTRDEPGHFHAIVLTTLPLHGANIVHFLNQRVDIFFLQAFHGIDSVGIYTIAVSLAQTVLFLSSALAVPLLPHVAGENDPQLASLATAHCCQRFVLLGTCAAAAVGVTSLWVVPLVFGRDFGRSLEPLLLLLPGMIAFGLTNLLVAYFAGTGQNRINLSMSLVGLSLTAAGNLTITRMLGPTGAALASSLAYGGMAITSLVIFCRQSGLPLSQMLLPDKRTVRSCGSMLAHLRP